MSSAPGWLNALRKKYDHPSELRAQRREAARGLDPREFSLLTNFPPPGREALVLGCGAGREVLALAAQGWRVTGADLARRPLGACGRELQQRRLDAVLVLLAAPASLPFADSSFDAVLMYGQLLEHLPARGERLALLREIERILRPGGAAYLSTHSVGPADAPEIGRMPAGGEDCILAARISPARSPGRLQLHLYERREILADVAAAGLDARAWLEHEEPGGGHPVWRRFLYLAAAKPG